MAADRTELDDLAEHRPEVAEWLRLQPTQTPRSI